ncbi:hypothetical protein ACH5RR_023612 [Cinchona calisaya]|uniref:Uncharacterized protein n=1 Tax=Cinchona calisaya TaxID=153742 RepID=A0ABD2ZB54_9GENT
MQNAIDLKVLKNDIYVKDGFQSDESNLIFHEQECIGKINELQFYIDTVEKFVKPGCSEEVLNVALTSMSSLVKTLSIMSSREFLLASL